MRLLSCIRASKDNGHNWGERARAPQDDGEWQMARADRSHRSAARPYARCDTRRRCEAQGKIWTWASLKSGNTANWLAEGKVRLLAQFGLAPAKDLPDVPRALDFARTAEDRQVMELIFAPIALGYPSFLGPGVPKERIEIMRRAFDKAVRDPEFIDLLKEQSLAYDPAPGQELQAIVGRMCRIPAPIVKLARSLIPSF